MHAHARTHAHTHAQAALARWGRIGHANGEAAVAGAGGDGNAGGKTQADASVGAGNGAALMGTSTLQVRAGLAAGIRRNAELLREVVAHLSSRWSTRTLVDVGSAACANTMALVELPLPAAAAGGRAYTPADGKAVQV